jgi:hypothetical protein
MKTTSQQRSKFSTKWQEFVEYMESIYFEDVLDTLTTDDINFEYTVFLDMYS